MQKYPLSLIALYRPTIALAALVTITACSSATSENSESTATDAGAIASECCAEDAGVVLLKMRGNEPFWHATLYRDQLHLAGLNREPQHFVIAEQNVTGSSEEEPVSHYTLMAEGSAEVTATLQAEAKLCRDSMSGMPYPNTVTFTAHDGEQLQGCAGNPEDLLIGSEWQIVAVAGEPVPADVTVTIEFSDTGAVYGSSGCNRYSGAYELTGENLLFGQLASTRMACAGTQMQVEDRVHKSFAEITAFDINAQGALQLLLQSGGMIEAVR